MEKYFFTGRLDIHRSLDISRPYPAVTFTAPQGTPGQELKQVLPYGSVFNKGQAEIEVLRTFNVFGEGMLENPLHGRHSWIGECPYCRMH